ncbi:MAG: mechanosensitive ion channel domain-containing protein [bacterium]
MNLFTDSTQFFIGLVPKLPMMILGLLFGYIIIKIFLMFIRKGLAIIHTRKAMVDIILPLSTAIMWVIFFSEFARHLGLSGIAVTFSGLLIIIGLALSNGTSALVGDLIAGVFLAKDIDFGVGYKIRFGDAIGIVRKVDNRKVRIESDDGHIFVIPTSKFDSTGWEVIDKAK